MAQLFLFDIRSWDMCNEWYEYEMIKLFNYMGMLLNIETDQTYICISMKVARILLNYLPEVKPLDKTA